MSRQRMKVLITVDTELSSGHGASTDSQLQDNIRNSFFGPPDGDGGLPYQLQQLHDHNLQAVFFIEALSPLVTGLQPLQDVVDLVGSYDQEIQLHTHTEWLQQAEHNPLDTLTGQHMHMFSAADQTHLVEIASNNLLECGVAEINAFRAGNYGANNNTLRALGNNGIAYDSSYNYPYLGSTCHIQAPSVLLQPTVVEGVTEVPVNFFYDRPGHARHTQLCACSFRELSTLLMRAHAAGYPTFVIVSHSFELLSRSRQQVNKILKARFQKLCRFLARRQDLFDTSGFNGWEAKQAEYACVNALKSPVHRTVGRYVEQLASRIYE